MSRANPLLYLLALLSLLPLGACAYQNNPVGAVGANDIIEVKLIFNDRVNPERFFYYLVFNFDADPSRTPRVDLDTFQDHVHHQGEFWDIYYLYGRPGDPRAPQPANFWKGFGGNDAGQPDLPLRRDGSGVKYIDILPNKPFDSLSLEYLDASVINGATDPADPNNNVLTANTIRYRFRAADFPTAPFTLLRNGKAKISILVANQGIDNVSNPDDLVDDCIIYDRFRGGSVPIDLTKKPKWSEETDPQENIEEDRLPRNPELNGPFKAADLVNWSVELIKQ